MAQDDLRDPDVGATAIVVLLLEFELALLACGGVWLAAGLIDIPVIVLIFLTVLTGGVTLYLGARLAWRVVAPWRAGEG